MTPDKEAWKRLGKLAKARRVELGLDQPGLKARGGPSLSTISAIENGSKFRYEPRILFKLEEALGWLPGSIGRILEGGEPTVRTPPAALRSAAPSGTESAIAADPYLDQRDKNLLIEMYRTMRTRERKAD